MERGRAQMPKQRKKISISWTTNEVIPRRSFLHIHLCSVHSQQTWKPISENIHRHFHVVKHLWCIAPINCFHLLAFIKTWIRFYFHWNYFFRLAGCWEHSRVFIFWCFANFLCIPEITSLHLVASLSLGWNGRLTGLKGFGWENFYW